MTTLYVQLDDRILPGLGFSRDRHPGRKLVLTDAELLCLVVAQQMLGIASDRKWIRYAHAHLKGMFPNLPQQSGWGKRVRQATGLLSA
ncbi:MAG: IS982 family transposase, partial [Sphingomonas bacterium]|nr:IS982 family transposase [Sphingomonas bacterium]